MPFFKKIGLITFVEGIKIPTRSISISSQSGSPSIIAINTPMTSELWKLQRGAHILVIASHDDWETDYVMFDGYFTGISQEKYAQGAANISLMGTSIPFALSRVKYYEISRAVAPKGAAVTRDIGLTGMQLHTPGIFSIGSEYGGSTSLTSNEMMQPFSDNQFAAALQECVTKIVRPGKHEYPFMVRADKEHRIIDRFFSGSEENNAYWAKTEIFPKYATSLLNSFGGLYTGHDVLSVVTAAAIKDYVELAPIGEGQAITTSSVPPPPASAGKSIGYLDSSNSSLSTPSSTAGSGGALSGVSPASASQSPWLDVAMREQARGVKEIPGPEANPRIIEYHTHTSLNATSDETAWCAAFVGFCLDTCGKPGVKGTNDPAARSYEQYGEACDPQPGAIAVFSRGDNPALGHVAFVVSVDAGDRITCVGGNQNNKVMTASFPMSSLITTRWPGDPPEGNTNIPPNSSQATGKSEWTSSTIRDVLIKPIAPFIPPPSCNVVFRTDLQNIGMRLDYSAMPTRAFLSEMPTLLPTKQALSVQCMAPSDQFPDNADVNSQEGPVSLDQDPTVPPGGGTKTLGTLSTPISTGPVSMTPGSDAPTGTNYVEQKGWSSSQKIMAKKVYAEAQRQGLKDPRIAIAVCMTEGSLDQNPPDNYNPPTVPQTQGGDTLDIGAMQINTQNLGSTIRGITIPPGAKHGRLPTNDPGRSWLRNIDNNISVGVAMIINAYSVAERTGAGSDDLVSKTYSAYNGGAGNVNRTPDTRNSTMLSNYKLLCGVPDDSKSSLENSGGSGEATQDPGSWLRTPDEDLLGLNTQTMNFPPQSHTLLVREEKNQSVVFALSDYIYYNNLYQGSTNLLALPYSPHIAVGFPLIIVDTSDADETMLGYVAAVNHMITSDGNATTQVSLTHFRHYTSRVAKFPTSTNPFVPMWFDQSTFAFTNLSTEFYQKYLGAGVFSVADISDGDSSLVESWVKGLKNEYQAILAASDVGPFQKRQFLTFDSWKKWHDVTGDYSGIEGIMFHGPNNPIMAGDLRVEVEWQTTIINHVKELNRTGQSL